MLGGIYVSQLPVSVHGVQGRMYSQVGEGGEQKWHQKGIVVQCWGNQQCLSADGLDAAQVKQL